MLRTLAATSLGLVAFAVVAPQAGATTPTISSVYGYADSVHTTSLDADAFVSGSWNVGDTITFYAYDYTSQLSNNNNSITMQTQPTLPVAGSCTVTDTVLRPFINGGQTTGDTGPCEITGLTPAHAYGVWAVPLPAGSAGVGSFQADYVGAQPSAAVITSAVPGPGSVTVNYTLGALGDMPYLDSNAYVDETVGNSTISQNCYPILPTPVAGSQLSCTVTGLQATTAANWSVSVYVNTQIGTSTTTSQGSSWGAILAPTLPGAPIVDAATPLVNASGSGATVYLTMPVSNGGAPISSWTCVATDTTTNATVTVTDYQTSQITNASYEQCIFSPTSQTVTPWNFATNNPGTPVTIPASPLTIGDSYTFSAKVTNSVGDSPLVAGSFSQIIAGAPVPPSNVVTTQGNGSAGGLNVNFTAGSANGSTISSYSVSASPESVVDTTCAASLPSGASSSSVKLDANDDEFILYVVPVNGQLPLYGIAECTPGGTNYHVSFPSTYEQFGGISAPVASGQSFTFYTTDTYYSGSPVFEISRWTFTPGVSPTLTSSQVGTYATQSLSPPLVMLSPITVNASGTAFYTTPSVCSSTCTQTLYQWTVSNGAITGTPLYAAPSGTVLSSTALDGSGNLFFSTASMTVVGGVTTYTNSELNEISASTLSTASGPVSPTQVLATSGYAPGIVAGSGTTLYLGGYSSYAPSTHVYANGFIESFDTSSLTTTVLAGTGGPSGYVEPGSPSGLTIDTSGNLAFIAVTASGRYVYVLPLGAAPPANSCTATLVSGSTYGCTITGLATNFYYSITVTAAASYPTWSVTNGVNGQTFTNITSQTSSVKSATATAYAAAPAAAPPAVTGVTASSSTGSGAIVVNWVAGVSQSLPSASSYVAKAYLGSSQSSAGSCTVSAPALTCTISNLAAGSYTVKVEADNPYAISSNSAPVTTDSTPVAVTVNQTVTDSVLSGLTAPVAGATPVTSINADAQFTGGTVTWSPAASTFATSTIYSATVTLTATTGYSLAGLSSSFFSAPGYTASSFNANTGVLTVVFQATAASLPTNVSDFTIAGLTAPSTGATPVSAITTSSQFTAGAVTWSPSASTFAGSTVYTASVTLTPASGYTLANTVAQDFTAPSGGSVTFNTSTGVLTETFPATAAASVTDSVISGLTAPVSGATPVTSIGSDAQFSSGTVTWSPSASTFATSTAYTASVTLTAASGYTLSSLGTHFFTVTGGTTSFNSGTGVLTITFPATTAAAPSAVTDSAISGLTAPVAGATPVTSIGTDAQFTSGAVTWSPAGATFGYGQAYTASVTLTAASGYTLNSLGTHFFTVAGGVASFNSGTGVLTVTFPATSSAPLSAVTDSAITGLTVPATGGTPVTSIGADAQFTSGTVTWSPAASTFAASTVYTATVTLTAASGYSLSSLGTHFFTVTGGTTSFNSGTGVLTVVFPATGAAAPTAVTDAAITGLTVPVTGATPVTSIGTDAQFTSGVVTWSPADTTFAGNTVYTASVELTAASGYTLSNLGTHFFTVSGGTTSFNSGTGVLTVVFPATAAVSNGGGQVSAPAVPAVPKPNRTATVTNGQTVELSWSAVANNGSVTVTSYTCSGPGVTSVTVTDTKCDLTGINTTVAGTYTFSVTANSASGSSDPATIILQLTGPKTVTTPTTTPPTPNKPVVKKPVTKKPVAKKPVVKKPVVKPVVKTPSKVTTTTVKKK